MQAAMDGDPDMIEMLVKDYKLPVNLQDKVTIIIIAIIYFYYHYYHSIVIIIIIIITIVISNVICSFVYVTIRMQYSFQLL
jgi:hypothetical protein